MDLTVNLAPSYRDLKDPTTRQNFDDTVEQKRVIDLRACLINCFGFQVKMEGFDLLSKESVALQNKQSSTSMEGDAWIISLHEAENLLLVGGARKKVLSILKTIRDRHLDLQVIR